MLSLMYMQSIHALFDHGEQSFENGLLLTRDIQQHRVVSQ
jgi:hypothetical protein